MNNIFEAHSQAYPNSETDVYFQVAWLTSEGWSVEQIFSQ
ncbi:hypothetical protein YTCETSXE_CDS0078 [Staphylococcus phage MVC_VPHSA2]|uniref:Uncharacterized protein n=1 Tax=Staphylococcus phage MVC_VPHSA1 TaxID=3088876 RepID=A0ABZ0QYL8_9CAUD|nr:hypothetical protein FBHYGVHD_CDS0048 [Staphylococcus phage MVC_VPHSA1]WPF65034.1 hypothetical protein YTCETSXE_CDS0078 [Staphylococcus phage MVC_VPHSA2]